MAETDSNEALGLRISRFRALCGMSVRSLAAAAGVSPGFVSQLENGKANPSVATLRKLAAALGVSSAELLDANPGYTRGVLRAADRPHHRLRGVDKYVVSTPPLRNFEVYAGRFEPGGSTGDAPCSHGDAQEMVVVTVGSVIVELVDEEYLLHQGDSIEFLTSVPHRVRNSSDELAEILWVISPPTSKA